MALHPSCAYASFVDPRIEWLEKSPTKATTSPPACAHTHTHGHAHAHTHGHAHAHAHTQAGAESASATRGSVNAGAPTAYNYGSRVTITGAGVIAGTKLLEIPYSSLLSDAAALRTGLGAYLWAHTHSHTHALSHTRAEARPATHSHGPRGAGGVHGVPEEDPIPPRVITCVVMLYERAHGGGRFSTYLRALPRDCQCACVWAHAHSEARAEAGAEPGAADGAGARDDSDSVDVTAATAFEWLDGTPLAREAAAKLAWLRSAYHILTHALTDATADAPGRPGGVVPSPEARAAAGVLLAGGWSFRSLLWAHCMYTSRGFPHALSMRPLAVAAPSQGVSKSAQDAADAHPAMADLPPGAAAAVTGCLVPCLDTLNHRPRARVTWMRGASALALITDEHLPVGAEVFNNYGPKSNADLLLGYGFVIPGNPFDVYGLRLGLSLADRDAACLTQLRHALERWSAAAAPTDVKANLDDRAMLHISYDFRHGFAANGDLLPVELPLKLLVLIALPHMPPDGTDWSTLLSLADGEDTRETTAVDADALLRAAATLGSMLEAALARMRRQCSLVPALVAEPGAPDEAHRAAYRAECAREYLRGQVALQRKALRALHDIAVRALVVPTTSATYDVPVKSSRKRARMAPVQREVEHAVDDADVPQSAFLSAGEDLPPGAVCLRFPATEVLYGLRATCEFPEIAEAIDGAAPPSIISQRVCLALKLLAGNSAEWERCADESIVCGDGPEVADEYKSWYDLVKETWANAPGRAKLRVKRSLWSTVMRYVDSCLLIIPAILPRNLLPPSSRCPSAICVLPRMQGPMVCPVHSAVSHSQPNCCWTVSPRRVSRTADRKSSRGDDADGSASASIEFDVCLETTQAVKTHEVLTLPPDALHVPRVRADVSDFSEAGKPTRGANALPDDDAAPGFWTALQQTDITVPMYCMVCDETDGGDDDAPASVAVILHAA